MVNNTRTIGKSQNPVNIRTTVRNCGGCYTLNRRLEQVEFALVDVILYLDAYPKCENALEYYHKLLAERDELMDSISRQCGPMTNLKNVSTSSWQWVDGPWPWHTEAN